MLENNREKYVNILRNVSKEKCETHYEMKTMSRIIHLIKFVKKIICIWLKLKKKNMLKSESKNSHSYDDKKFLCWNNHLTIPKHLTGVGLLVQHHYSIR